MTQDDCEQINAIKLWAKKRMDRHIKKVKHYAEIYFGCVVTVEFIDKNTGKMLE